jgi:glutamyl-tRNA synthetase
MDAEARSVLAALLPRLAATPEWTAATLESEVRSFSEDSGIKLGKVAQPLRAALTGRSISPPVFDVMHALGRDESLSRLKDLAG